MGQQDRVFDHAEIRQTLRLRPSNELVKQRDTVFIEELGVCCDPRSVDGLRYPPT